MQIRATQFISAIVALSAFLAASSQLAADEPQPCPPSLPVGATPPPPCEPTYQIFDLATNNSSSSAIPGTGYFNRTGLSSTPSAPITPISTGCADSAFALTSQCWRHDFFNDPGQSVVPYLDPQTVTPAPQTAGFPLNINIYQVPRWTNLPPLSQSAAAGTAPLVASPIARPARPLFLTDRQTVAGVVDAITGQPLLREIDLELPLGSSTYRVLRTYGGDPWGEKLSSGTFTRQWEYYIRTWAAGRMWDWCGVGWMLGENPLLLIDSQHIGHDPTLPPRCELILDAHHSIPFTKDTAGGVTSYAAPSWFDALLYRRPAVGTGPETVDVYLHGKSAKYTFEVIPDDVYIVQSGPTGNQQLFSAHEPPALSQTGSQPVKVVPPGDDEIDGVSGKGMGVPHYGLLKQIEDAQGNRVVIDHCVFNPRGAADWPETPGCEECLQNCTEKGQIRSVKLKTADGVVRWTLLYVHRSFRLWEPGVDCAVANYADPSFEIPQLLTARDKDSAWFQQNALAAVYAFEGDRDFSAKGCWTVPAETFVKEGNNWIESIDQQDQFDWDERFAAALDVNESMLAGWSHRLRFTYDEVCSGLQEEDPPSEKIFHWGSPGVVSKHMPVLLRVERLSRERTVSGVFTPPTRSLTAYTYATESDETYPSAGHTGSEGRAIPKVRSIFRHDGLARMLKEYATEGATMNAPFSPRPVSGTASTAWRDHDLDRFAEMTFDWKPIDSTTLATSNFARRLILPSSISAAPTGASAVAPLSGIESESLFASGHIGVVSRAILRGLGAADGTYDLLYFHVAPSEGTCTQYALSGNPPPAFHAEQGTTGQSSTAPPCGFPGTSAYGSPHPTCVLFPFNWQPPTNNDVDVKVGPSPLQDVMWLVLADRHPTPKHDAVSPPPEYSISTHVTNPAQPGLPPLPDSRQVIALNAAGYTLWSRNWDYLTGGVDAVGPSEEFVYESKSKFVTVISGGIEITTEVPALIRLKEHRSLGWGVAALEGVSVADTAGLITKYTYDDRPLTGGGTEYSTLIKTIAVQQGVRASAGDLEQSLIRSFEYPASTSAADRESPIESISYGGPSATLPSQARSIRRFFHSREQNQLTDDPDRLMEEIVWGSPAPLWPGGPLLSPFERKYFDIKGLLLARAYGLAADPSPQSWSPATNDLVFVDVFSYDRHGQKRVSIVDCDTCTSSIELPSWWAQIGGLPPSSTETPILPTNAYKRKIPADLPGGQNLDKALHLCTGFRYADQRLDCVAKPDRRIDFFGLQTWTTPIHQSGSSPYTVSEAAICTFVDGVFVSDSLVFSKPGKVQLVRDGEAVKAWTVQWSPFNQPIEEHKLPHGGGVSRTEFSPGEGLATDLTTPSPPANHFYSIVAELTPEYDDSGRVTKATFTGKGAHATEPLEQEAAYTDFGLVGKRVEPSGTISRTVFNPLGQAVLEFRGTRDFSEYWQRQQPTGVDDDNLMLIRKNWFGTGIQNIRKPTQTRIFRSKPSVRPQDAQVDASGQFTLAPNEDDYGWLEKYGYDRRMRPVWTETRSDITGQSPGDGDLIKVHATWLDNLDRPRFAAVFEASAAVELDNSSIDPRDMDVYLTGPPTAAQILNLKPASLTEYIYNARGEREEERRYDVDTSSGTAYTASRSYFNHTGQPVTVISDGGRININLYDAIGRLASSVTFVDDNATATISDAREIERIDNQYSKDAQLEVSSRYVRTLDTGLALIAGSSGNAVRTDSINWYNDKQQLIATAELGSGSANDTFKNDDNGPSGSGTSQPPLAPSADGSPFATPPVWNSITKNWSGDAWTSYARISTNEEYDDLGRVTKSRAPSGALTQRTFDALNRVIDERVVPPSTSDATVHTAYHYERGRLKYIGAVVPNYTGAVDWNLRDGSIQITELVYDIGEDTNRHGAIVVDPFTVSPVSGRYEPISENFDWPRGVRLPWATCACDFDVSGTVAADDIFAFLDAWFIESAACTDCSASGCPSCDTDFNGDESVTADDIFAFLDCWFAAPPNCGASSSHANDDNWLDVSFTYTIDGLIAERTEHITSELANTIQHTYDELGRRTRILAKTDQDVTSAAITPVATIDKVDYAYDVLDRLTRSTAHSRDGAGGTAPSTRYVVADNAFAYDPWGHLHSEHASYGESLATDSSGAFTNGREISYTWQRDTAPGPTSSSSPITLRLSQMVLPWGPIGAADGSGNPTPEQHRLLLAYSYGASNSTNDALSRVQSISHALFTTPPASTAKPVAAFKYYGSSSRRALILGPDLYGTGFPAIAQDFSSGSTTDPALPHLDRFGRTHQLRYAYTPASPSAPVELWKAEYAYDPAGNRIRERLWLGAPGSNISPALGSDRSWVYTYDGHDRLIDASSGIVNASGQFIRLDSDSSPTTGFPAFAETWELDHLGIWQTTIGGHLGNEPEGRTHSHYGTNGTLTSRSALDHRTGFRNQIEKIDTATYNTVTESWSTTQSGSVFYDAHGRMVFDGAHLYQHDLFGRVAQIRSSGLLDPAVINPDTGLPNSGADLSGVGQLLVHYTYDGLGRVIREQRPERPPTTPPSGVAAGTPVTLKITDKYYDGVRAVQEVTQRAVPLREMETESGSPPVARAHYLPWRTDEFPTSQPRASGPLSTTLGSAWSLEKTYIHAADPGAYVDEVLAQLVYLDEAGEPAPDAITLYTLQDANYNVVALADEYGRLAAQYTYLPYGKVRTAELLANPSTGPPGSTVAGTYWSRVLAAAGTNRLGHQGLPVERLDPSGPWSHPMGSDGTLPWNGVSNSALLGGLPPTDYAAAYHNRNRLYAPDLGRFLSSDPNGTGLPTLDSMSFGGMGLSGSSINPDYQSHYGDGMNSHAAYGANPLGSSDPTGLYTNWSNYSGAWDGGGGGSWDPFDMVDEFIAEDLGSKAALLQPLGRGYEAGILIASTIAQMHPFVGIPVSAYNILSGQGTVWDLAGFLPGARAAGPASRLLSRVGGAFSRTQAGYAAMSVGRGVTRQLSRLERIVPDELLQGPKDTYVYIGWNPKPVYVGITNDLSRRQREHGNRFRITPITQKLTRQMALAVETLIIGSNPQFQNNRRSISPSNPMFGEYMEAATDFLNKNGIQIFY